MKKQKIKCHGHKCPDNAKCPLYSIEHVEGDSEKGNDSIDCDIRIQYENKLR